MTAGESHGPALTAIVEGLPAGISVGSAAIDHDLRRRQVGYGRGGRMEIERDRVEISAGVRHGVTLGSPVALVVRNRDWENWREEMAVEEVEAEWETQRGVRVPRPGHADLAGGAKYRHGDLRNVLERASARETAARVAVGAVCRCLLKHLDIQVVGMVQRIGEVVWDSTGEWRPETIDSAEASDVRCPDPRTATSMRAAIDRAREDGDTLGGVFEIRACGVVPGVGSHVSSDRRLDGRLAGALMSIQAIKGVEIGLGFGAASRLGSRVHDPITVSGGQWPFGRTTNNAGGIEGGMSNGETICVRAAMKPIPTLTRPLPSVCLDGLSPVDAHAERSDVCAVPAAAVVGEAVVCFELARALLEMFGDAHVDDILRAMAAYRDDVARIWARDGG